MKKVTNQTDLPTVLNTPATTVALNVKRNGRGSNILFFVVIRKDRSCENILANKAINMKINGG